MENKIKEIYEKIVNGKNLKPIAQLYIAVEQAERNVYKPEEVRVELPDFLDLVGSKKQFKSFLNKLGVYLKKELKNSNLTYVQVMRTIMALEALGIKYNKVTSKKVRFCEEILSIYHSGTLYESDEEKFIKIIALLDAK